MKIMLMSAGKGERLGELTKEIPKCLLHVGGKPILKRWIDKFVEWKFSDVLINISYQQEKVCSFLGECDWGESRLTLFKEKQLLGTAKTLLRNKKFAKGEYYFGVAYSDVWTTFDMRKMVTFHKRRPTMVTLGLHVPKTYEGKGIAVVKDGLVVGFEEKPKSPKSKYVWAGMLVAHPSIFSVMNEGMKDIATDLLPKLAETGRMSAFFIDEPVYDIGGTIEEYRRVNEEVKKIGLGAL